MLELALYVIIFEFLDRFFSKSLKKQLMQEASSQRRIMIRRRVKRNRFLLLVGFLLFLIATEVYLIYDAFSQPGVAMASNSFAYFPVLCIIYFCFQNKWKRIKGNISTYDLDTFRYKNEHYSLYLRGFDSDDYQKIDQLENPGKESYDHLSEYWFFKLLSKRYQTPVVSVGMTKELDSPFGTKRVYLDDEEWKAGVRTLMEHADRIFILINDRVSCIWEIAQSKDFLDKTLFIADDGEKYRSAQKKVKAYINLPQVLLLGGQCVLIQGRSADKVRYFENSRKGYAEIMGVTYTSSKAMRKKRLTWGCLVPLAVVLSIGLMVAIVSRVRSGADSEEPEEIEQVEDEFELLDDMLEGLDDELEVDSVYSPFDELREVLGEVEVPQFINEGMYLDRIKIMEEDSTIQIWIDVIDSVFDMKQLKQQAKTDLLNSISSSDEESLKYRFWTLCMDREVTVYCVYTSHSDDFWFTITPNELRAAFKKRR